MQQVLVAGGTGMVGGAITKALVEKGHAVTVLARKAGNPAAGVRFVQGDVTDPETVNRAANDCDVAVIALSGTPGRFGLVESIGTINIQRAMLTKSGTRIIYVSGSSTSIAPAWFEAGQAKRAAEKALLSGSVPALILRPSWFMESWNRMIRGQKVSWFGTGLKPVHWLALQDFAECIAVAAASEAAMTGVLPVYGPERLSFQDAGMRFAKSRSLKGTAAAPLWLGRIIGMLDPQVMAATQLFRVFSFFEENENAVESAKLLGKPTTRFDDWLNQQ